MRARRLLGSLAVLTLPSACSLVLGIDELPAGEHDADVGMDGGGGANKDAAGAQVDGDAAPSPAADATTRNDASDASSGPLTYAGQVIADGPVAYWRLGDVVGKSIAVSAVAPMTYDAVYDNDMHPGVPGAIFGDPDTAARGGGDYGSVKVGDVLANLGKTPFTIELWLRPSADDDGGYRYMFLRHDDAMDFAGFLHNGGSGLQVSVNFVRSTGSSAVVEDFTAPPGTWTYLVLTYDEVNLRLYLDGASAGVDAVRGQTLDGGEGGFAIGSDLGEGAEFDGDLDEFAVYEHALDPPTISLHYALGVGPDGG